MVQGEPGDSMFILSEGLLQAYIHPEVGEKQICVGQIEPGEFFGEMSLLTGENRSATVVASTDAVAHEITRDHMTELLRRRPSVAQTLSRVVAERRMEISESLAATPDEDRVQRAASLADQIMDRMRSFFRGVFDS